MDKKCIDCTCKDDCGLYQDNIFLNTKDLSKKGKNMNTQKHLLLKIPIKIITPKIAPDKTNSIFYSSKNIAYIKAFNQEYILTTAGEYKFYVKENDNTCYNEESPVIQVLSDKHIKNLDNNGLIDNWGWFGINKWIDNKFYDTLGECYSLYDEALNAFITLVKEDLMRHIK